MKTIQPFPGALGAPFYRHGPRSALRSAGRLLCALGAASALNAQAQMAVQGQFAVADGAATYSIPIKLPVGASGLQPSLAISYSSQSSNGLLGQGWDLAGLSSISRCAPTKAQDGIAVPVTIKYDTTDRYCLDGQRLFAIAGSYTGPGEYRTERESFSKIESFVESGVTGGPGSFVVKTSAGLRMEYGKTSDSRIEAQGKTAIAVWALNKVSDTVGNYYTVSYAKDSANGSWRPATISYTGNGSLGALPNQSVTFGYESRPDVLSTYVGGAKSSHQLRLRQVTLSDGKYYLLTYGATELTGHSRLSRVDFCAGTGGCLPPTSFTYSPVESLSTPSMIGNPIAAADMNGGVGAIQVGDWNGDGRADIMWFDKTTGNNRWYVSNGSLSFTKYTNPIPAASLNGGNGAVYAGDWNGDGIQDLLWYDRVSGNNRWYVGNGAMSFTAYNNPIAAASINGNIGGLFFGDWNGDGRADVMWYDKASGQNRWFVSTGVAGGAPAFTTYSNPIPTTTINAGSGIFFGDWNGDGVTDVMWFNSVNGENRWLTSNGNMTFALTSNPVPLTDLNGDGNIVFGDWNGDNLTDLLWYNKAGNNRWFVSNGSLGFTKQTDPIAPASINGTGPTIQAGDWNGDGRTDILWYDIANGNNRWFINNGAMSFAAPLINPIAPADVNGSEGLLYFGDWNGNGVTDMLYYASKTGINRWYLNQGSAGHDLTQIDQGLGAGSRINVGYGALPELLGVQYFKEFVPVYPKLSMILPMRVVKSTQVPDGVGGLRTTSYSYGNLLNEVAGGRGVLGFQWIQTKDQSTGTVSRTYYRQDWPYLGLVERSGKGTSETAWSNLGQTVNTSFVCVATAATNPGAACASNTVVPGSRYFIYPSQIDSQAWDYDGVTGSGGVFTALPRSRTTQTLDPLTGNVTTIKVETLKPDGAASGFSQTTVNTYAPTDTANWYLGRLLRSTVTSTTP